MYLPIQKNWYKIQYNNCVQKSNSSITDLGSFRSLFNCTYFFAVIESFIPAVLQSARPKKKSYDAEPT